MYIYPPLNGGITAISSAGCSEITALSDKSIYSWFNANNRLFFIGSNLHTHISTYMHFSFQLYETNTETIKAVKIICHLKSIEFIQYKSLKDLLAE